MIELIEALNIFVQYGRPASPTHCEHDVLTVMIDPAKVSTEHLARLDELGFFPADDGSGTFQSYRFGSA